MFIIILIVLFVGIVLYLVNTLKVANTLVLFYSTIVKALYSSKDTEDKTKMMLYAFDDNIQEGIDYREYNKFWKHVCSAWQIPYSENKSGSAENEKMLIAINDKLSKYNNNPDLEPMVTRMVNMTKNFKNYEDFYNFLKKTQMYQSEIIENEIGSEY